MCGGPSRSPSTCGCVSPSRSAAISPTTACSTSLRLGNRWDLAFHQSLKRDAKGDVVEFDADPRLIEQFATEASAAIRKFTEDGTSVVLAVTPEARPYVRMILERVFPTLPILSHVEVARSAEIRSLGAIS